MLSKKHRMPKALARDVFMRGSTVPTPHFLIKTTLSPNGPTDTTLFAVAISKKIAPTAVLRNRTRRRVYSVIRDLLPRVKPGLCVAISVKRGGEKLAHPDIVQEIESVLLKIHVI